MTALRLTSVEILALRKCEAAERFTTVWGTVPKLLYLELQKRGLTEWRGGMRLSAAGRDALAALQADGGAR